MISAVVRNILTTLIGYGGDLDLEIWTIDNDKLRASVCANLGNGATLTIAMVGNLGSSLVEIRGALASPIRDVSVSRMVDLFDFSVDYQKDYDTEFSDAVYSIVSELRPEAPSASAEATFDERSLTSRFG